jgi:hypothetical protein
VFQIAQLDLNHISLPDNSPAKTRLGGPVGGNAQKGNTETKQENIEGRGGVEDGKLKEDHCSAHETEDEDYSAFSQLVLPEGHKDMVKSLVAQHFRNKDSQEEQQVDIVSGKGEKIFLAGENPGSHHDRKGADHSLTRRSWRWKDNHRW